MLNYGIKPEFYGSEYNHWYEDGMFSNPVLEKFCPDLIYICTYIRNIDLYPGLSATGEAVEKKRHEIFRKFSGLWMLLTEIYRCPIIQNNFEYPYFRLMGNRESSAIHGRVNYVTMLKCFFEYAGDQYL